jgi:hypothetical protein
VYGDNEIFIITNDLARPLLTPETGFIFPLEYAAGIVAVIVAVALVAIFFARKK